MLQDVELAHRARPLLQQPRVDARLVKHVLAGQDADQVAGMECLDAHGTALGVVAGRDCAQVGRSKSSDRNLL